MSVWAKNKFRERFSKVKTLEEALIVLEEAYKTCKDVNKIALAFCNTSESITKYLIELDIYNKKWCYDCKTWKEKIQFNNKRSTTDGLSYQCKLCSILETKRYNSIPKNKENLREKAKEYNSRLDIIEHHKEYFKTYISNPEIKEQRKQYSKEYDARPDIIEHHKEYKKDYNSRPEVIEYRKEYDAKYYSNPEVIARRNQYNKDYKLRPEYEEYNKEYNKEYSSRPEVMEHRKEYNKEYNSKPEVIEYRKEYRLRPDYKEYHRQYDRKYFKERRKTDIAFRIRTIISSRINLILKDNNSSKFGESISKYLPYTIQELIDHLVSKFQPGMTLENHGYYGWHIDHKKPVSSFKITSMECEEFQECWALSNLQPLWWQDNLAKGNKYEEPTDEELEEILENLSDEELQEVLKD